MKMLRCSGYKHSLCMYCIKWRCYSVACV